MCCVLFTMYFRWEYKNQEKIFNLKGSIILFTINVQWCWSKVKCRGNSQLRSCFRVDPCCRRRATNRCCQESIGVLIFKNCLQLLFLFYKKSMWLKKCIFGWIVGAMLPSAAFSAATTWNSSSLLHKVQTRKLYFWQ